MKNKKTNVILYNIIFSTIDFINFQLYQYLLN